MRDNEWLNQRLDNIWNLLFLDVKRANNVNAKFKGKWKNKFGHIRMQKDKSSEIAVNSLFRHDVIPEYIIDVTIAHELVHYSHGFNSPLEKKYKHPHKGGIVNKELIKRGFGHMVKVEKDFIKTKWFKLYRMLNYDL